jgi:hypothetical protein
MRRGGFDELVSRRLLQELSEMTRRERRGLGGVTENPHVRNEECGTHSYFFRAVRR